MTLDFIVIVLQAVQVSSLKLVSASWLKSGFPSLRATRFRVSCAVIPFSGLFFSSLAV